MAANECIPFRKPGDAQTGQVTSAVTGKRFVKASTTLTKIGDNVKVAPATAGGAAYGVAGFDQATVGAAVLIHSGSGIEVPVTADGTVTVGDLVEVGTAGKAKTKASGVVVGYALNTASDGQDVRVSLR